MRRQSGELRVVRIGTHGVSHGSKSTLWNRLRTHRGTTNGLGRHRSSVFRRHVGAALSSRDPAIRVSSWGKRQNIGPGIRAAEANLERLVSAHIGAMSLLWLAVGDDPGPSSDRAYLERNLIGMLAGRLGPADPPSKHWLGLSSPNDPIRQSGLWNLDYLDYSYSPECLDVFEHYVAITLGEKRAPAGSIAPHNGYRNDRRGGERSDRAS